MAQIAGRAGRHHKEGTFGSLGHEDGDAAFTPEEIEAIEAHRFPPVEQLFWRDGTPRTDRLDHLLSDLEQKPERPELRPAPEAVDLAVLKRLARSEEHTSELQSLMRISYAVFCLTKKNRT